MRKARSGSRGDTGKWRSAAAAAVLAHFALLRRSSLRDRILRHRGVSLRGALHEPQDHRRRLRQSRPQERARTRHPAAAGASQGGDLQHPRRTDRGCRGVGSLRRNGRHGHRVAVARCAAGRVPREEQQGDRDPARQPADARRGRRESQHRLARRRVGSAGPRRRAACAQRDLPRPALRARRRGPGQVDLPRAAARTPARARRLPRVPLRSRRARRGRLRRRSRGRPAPMGRQRDCVRVAQGRGA